MKLHTEKEYLINSSFFAYKLRDLYVQNKELFFQVADYIPNLIYINQGIAQEISYGYRNKSKVLTSVETEKLFKKGGGYLFEISCPILYERSKQKAMFFKKQKDLDGVCSYLQNITIQRKKVYTYTNKLFLSETSFLNISDRISNIDSIDKIFTSVFDFVLKDQYIWQRFMSLTKQEKLIIRLLADGSTNKKVGEQLFITTDTVKTHRRNIYRKLDIHTLGDLIKVAMVLEFPI